MRSSIRFSGSSKDRSSRKSEKSKPSSSLTGTKTASIGNSLPSPRRPVSSTVPGTRGGSPRSRNSRQAWPAGGIEPPISVAKKFCVRIASAGWSKSSSAGSDHFETDPWPSVSTKYPLTIWRRIPSSGSTGPAVSASTASTVSEGGLVRGFIEGSPERQAWGGFSSLIGRRSHSSSRVAAARESSDEVPPALRASDVVKRSS